MHSSADVDDALQRALDEAMRVVDGLQAPVVLIDGRSGSGKSTLARALSARLGGTVLALDCVYPGWDGLAAGADHVIRDVLAPLSRGERGTWTRWDWAADAPAERHAIDPGDPLIVEGVGILTPVSAPYADVSIWLDSPKTSRRSRALERDGDAYRPHWQRWAAQELEHMRRNAPRGHATFVVPVP